MITAGGLSSIWQQFLQFIAGDVRNTNAGCRNTSCSLWRSMNHPCHQWPWCTCRTRRLLHQKIADAGSGDRLRWVRCIPTNRVHSHAALCKDVPKRFGLACCARGHTNTITGWVRFNKIENAVLLRGLAGGNGGPQNRREFRFQSAKVCPCSCSNQCCKMWHLPPRDQRIDDLPISSVPTKNQ